MTETGLKGFRRNVAACPGTDNPAKTSAAGTLFFIERTRPEADGIHQRVLAAFASGFIFRRFDELAAHAGSAYGIAHPEKVDIQPVAFTHPNEPAEHGADVVPHVNANIPAECGEIQKLRIVGSQAGE